MTENGKRSTKPKHIDTAELRWNRLGAQARWSSYARDMAHGLCEAVVVRFHSRKYRLDFEGDGRPRSSVNLDSCLRGEGLLCAVMGLGPVGEEKGVKSKGRSAFFAGPLIGKGRVLSPPTGIHPCFTQNADGHVRIEDVSLKGWTADIGGLTWRAREINKSRIGMGKLVFYTPEFGRNAPRARMAFAIDKNRIIDKASDAEIKIPPRGLAICMNPPRGVSPADIEVGTPVEFTPPSHSAPAEAVIAFPLAHRLLQSSGYAEEIRNDALLSSDRFVRQYRIRTAAVGITPDYEVVLALVDWEVRDREALLKTVARLMKDLGCVNAACGEPGSGGLCFSDGTAERVKDDLGSARGRWTYDRIVGPVILVKQA